MLNLAPNPASEQFQLSVPTDWPQRADLTMTNALGVVCLTRQVELVLDQPMVIPTSALAEGTYVVEVRMQGSRQRAMVVVQH